MLRHPADDTLHRLMDGALPPREAAAAERHVAVCGRCRTLVDQLERLRRVAAAAPREVAPPDECWEALRARIARTPQAQPEQARPEQTPAPRRTPRRLGRWAAVVALLLPLGAVSLVVRAARRDGDGTARASLPSPRAAAPALATTGRRRAGDLAAELGGRRGLLTGETLRAAEENLRQLDAAIASTEAALAAYPDNVHLETMLTRARRQQAEYVQSARALTSDQ